LNDCSKCRVKEGGEKKRAFVPQRFVRREGAELDER